MVEAKETRTTADLKLLTTGLADRYHIERVIARGGMATVLLAQERRPPRKVAIKVLDSHVSHGLERERFLREIELIAQLNHPHIVPVFSAGETKGLLYYVMPFIEGQSLRKRLVQDGPPPLTEALRVAHDVANALEYAHGHDIVHRDIKPENILLSGGHALVNDFGIARVLCVVCDDKLTPSGFQIGTPGYMSPEQAHGDGEVDHRSDVYSLAAVVYEMLHGEPPSFQLSFRSTNGGAGASGESHDGATGPVPEALWQALLRALAFDPDERFQTVAEFSQALASVITPTPVHTGLRFTGAHRVLGRTSVAVLPFMDLGTDGNDHRFGDGIADDIITELSKQNDLDVTSRTSVMRYKDTTRGMREISQELGVRVLLEGSVRVAGGRVRITAQLIDGQTDTHLWAETYDRKISDVLEVQRDVAKKIARALPAAIKGSEEPR